MSRGFVCVLGPLPDHSVALLRTCTRIASTTCTIRHAEYRLLGKLGEGTFSEVLRVRNKKNGKTFAMKRFRKHFKRYA